MVSVEDLAFARQPGVAPPSRAAERIERGRRSTFVITSGPGVVAEASVARAALHPFLDGHESGFFRRQCRTTRFQVRFHVFLSNNGLEIEWGSFSEHVDQDGEQDRLPIESKSKQYWVIFNTACIKDQNEKWCK